VRRRTAIDDTRTSHKTPTEQPTRQVVLVTRTGCHLCAEAESLLRRLSTELGFGYREVDVDADPVRRDTYSDRVPVILIDGKEHGYWRVEEARFRRAIAR
jgi:glutaredoxin